MRVQSLFLGRRVPSRDFSALAGEGDRAAIRVWCSHIGGHLRTEITSGHVTDCRLREALESGKKAKKPL